MHCNECSLDLPVLRGEIIYTVGEIIFTRVEIIFTKGEIIFTGGETIGGANKVLFYIYGSWVE